mgnify:FL=1
MSSSGSNAARGAVQGAQFGGQVGGSWGAAIGGTIGLLAGAFGGDPLRHAKKAQERYNAEVVKHTAMSLFDRERAQQVERMRTAKALQSYQAQGKTQISTVRANYGAADLVGASAQALAQTLDYQTKQAEAATLFNYGVSFDNYVTDIEAIGQRGVNSLQRTLDAAPQQAMDIGQLYAAGKSMYEGFKQMGSNRGGFNAGLQFGTQPQSTQPQTSNYSLPSNLNLQFKGF